MLRFTKYPEDALSCVLNKTVFASVGTGTNIVGCHFLIPETTGLTVLWTAINTAIIAVALQGGNIGQHNITAIAVTSDGTLHPYRFSVVVRSSGVPLTNIPPALAPPASSLPQPACLLTPNFLSTPLYLVVPDGRILTL